MDAENLVIHAAVFIASLHDSSRGRHHRSQYVIAAQYGDVVSFKTSSGLKRRQLPHSRRRYHIYRDDVITLIT